MTTHLVLVTFKLTREETLMSTISVTWMLSDGTSRKADVPVGLNLMEAAITNGVSGIAGDCGGALACATCHVEVVNGCADSKTARDMENDMLDMVEGDRFDNSRLSCQLVASSEMDGIVLRIP